MVDQRSECTTFEDSMKTFSNVSYNYTYVICRFINFWLKLIIRTVSSTDDQKIWPCNHKIAGFCRMGLLHIPSK